MIPPLSFLCFNILHLQWFFGINSLVFFFFFVVIFLALGKDFGGKGGALVWDLRHHFFSSFCFLRGLVGIGL